MIAGGAIAFLAVVILAVMIGSWVGDGLGVEPSGERRSASSYVTLGVAGVLIVIGALIVTSMRSWLEDQTEAARRRRGMPSEALKAMTRYFAATCKSEQCLRDADERMVLARIGLGYQGMPTLGSASGILSPGKLSALASLRENARRISRQDRHTLARAAILLFLGSGASRSVADFQTVIGAIGALPKETRDLIGQALM